VPADTSTQTGPNVIQAQRTIWNGTPGDKFTNDTSKVLYQFMCDLVNTCGQCLQYHLAIGAAWPLPLHVNCRCRQVAIPPGDEAPHAYVNFQTILKDLPKAKQVAAVGASNYKLIADGTVKWSDVVTPTRVRDLREVVANKRLSIDTLTSAGVKPTVAAQAHLAVNTPEHVLVDQTRRRLIDQLKGAGLNQAQVVNAIASKLAERLTIAPGTITSNTTEPTYGASQITTHGPALADLLAGFGKATSKTFGSSKANVVPYGDSTDMAKVESDVRDLLGKDATTQDLVSVAGVTDGVTAKVSHSDTAGGVGVTVKSQEYDLDRRITRDKDGNVVLYADSLYVTNPGQGLGADIFGRMVEQAQKFGVDKIETTASRSATENGYYTWAKFGYDGPLSGPIRAMLRVAVDEGALPGSLASATTVSELMGTTEGTEWWKTNGESTKMTFDLTPGSQSLQVWNTYLKQKAAK
jgi:hypothetical protein